MNLSQSMEHDHGKIFTSIHEDPWKGLLTEEEEKEHYERLVKRFTCAEHREDLCTSTTGKDTSQNKGTVDQKEKNLQNIQVETEDEDALKEHSCCADINQINCDTDPLASSSVT